jgi:hypothetical protein
MGLLLLVRLPSVLKPSGLAFDPAGIHYWRGTDRVLLVWAELAAVGIGYEEPPDVDRYRPLRTRSPVPCSRRRDLRDGAWRWRSIPWIRRRHYARRDSPGIAGTSHRRSPVSHRPDGSFCCLRCPV